MGSLRVAPDVVCFSTMLSGTNGLTSFALTSHGAIATAASSKLAISRIRDPPGCCYFSSFSPWPRDAAMIRLFLGNYLYPLGNFGTARKKLKVWELITPRLSALGHKRTSDDRSGISALPSKADLFSIGANVRYVPEADTYAAALPQRKPVRAERGQNRKRTCKAPKSMSPSCQKQTFCSHFRACFPSKFHPATPQSGLLGRGHLD